MTDQKYVDDIFYSFSEEKCEKCSHVKETFFSADVSKKINEIEAKFSEKKQ